MPREVSEVLELRQQVMPCSYTSDFIVIGLELPDNRALQLINIGFCVYVHLGWCPYDIFKCKLFLWRNVR